MKIFKLNKQYSIVANWEKTRSGFRHVANLMRDGQDVGFAKAVYYNRTWESYEYQTVITDLVQGSDVLSEKEKKLFLKKIKVGFR